MILFYFARGMQCWDERVAYIGKLYSQEAAPRVDDHEKLYVRICTWVRLWLPGIAAESSPGFSEAISRLVPTCDYGRSST